MALITSISKWLTIRNGFMSQLIREIGKLSFHVYRLAIVLERLSHLLKVNQEGGRSPGVLKGSPVLY